MGKTASIEAFGACLSKNQRSTLRCCWTAVALAWISTTWTCTADPLDIWHWRHPSPTGNRLYALGVSSNRYLAVGELGSIARSENGRDWINVDSGTLRDLRGVVWGDGLWVAVGDSGQILTSPDAQIWTPRPTGYFYDLHAVTWANDIFVAVGENCAILTSADGLSWSLRTSGTDPLRAIAFGNGVFIAGGGEPPSRLGQFQSLDGHPLVLTSPDGLSWRQVDLPVDGQVSAIAYGAGRFVAVTTSNRAMVSHNGTDWELGFEHLNNYDQFDTVAFVNGRFLSSYHYGYSGLYSQYFASPDGMSWTPEPWDLGSVFQAMVTGPAGTVGSAWNALNYFAPIGFLVFSPDGRHWKRLDRHLPQFEFTPTFAGGKFFLREAAGYVPGSGLLRAETTYLISSDAQNWDLTEVSADQTFGLPVYGNGRWVGCGDNGAVVLSTNLLTWSQLGTGVTNALQSIAFVAGQFLITGDNGLVLSSTDGRVWANHSLPVTNTLGPATWFNGRFLAPEAGTNSFFTSSDAISWTRQLAPINMLLIEKLATWSHGWLALCRTQQYAPAQIMQSSDAQTWLPLPLPAGEIDGMAAANDWLMVFHGFGSRTVHARRAADTNWSAHVLPWVTLGNDGGHYGVAGGVFGQNSFLLIHYLGYIIQSDPVSDTPPVLTLPLTGLAASMDALVRLQASALGSAPLSYQWYRDGTNLPSATTPFLALAAGDLASSRITITVQNPFGTSESAPATLVSVEPARLELRAGLSWLHVFGSGNARYRIESSSSLMPDSWSFLDEVQIPSTYLPTHLNLNVGYYAPDQAKFFRAIVEP